MSSNNEKSLKPSFKKKSPNLNEKVFDDYLNSDVTFEEMRDKMITTSSNTKTKASSPTHHLMQRNTKYSKHSLLKSKATLPSDVKDATLRCQGCSH